MTSYKPMGRKTYLRLRRFWRNFSREWKEKLFCRFFHKRYRCYPEVWLKEKGRWHCARCYPCGDIFDYLDQIAEETEVLGPS